MTSLDAVRKTCTSTTRLRIFRKARHGPLRVPVLFQAFFAALGAMVVIVYFVEEGYLPAVVLLVNDTFCCEEEAFRLFSSADPTLDPCDNFTGYVCGSLPAQGKQDVSVLDGARMRFEAEVFQGTNHRRKGKSSHFLAVLYSGCVNTLWNHDALVQQVTEAIIDMTNINPAESVMALWNYFFFVASVVQVPAAVQILLRGGPGKEVLKISYASQPLETTASLLATLNASLQIFNAKFKTNVKTDDVLAFHSSLAAEGAAVGYIAVVVPVANISTVLPSLSLTVLRRLLLRYRGTYGEGDVHVNGAVNIEALFSALKSVPAAGIAYLVTQCTSSAVDSLASFHHYREQLPSTQSFKRCESLCYEISLTWHRLHAERLTDPTRDAYVSDLFESVRSAVVSDISSGDVFREEEKPLALVVVNRKELLVPSYLLLNEFPLPEASSARSFARNFLEGRDYQRSVLAWAQREFSITRQHDSSALFSALVDVGGEYVYAAPLYYETLHFDGPPSTQILDMATYGIEVARVLWEAALNTVVSENAAERWRDGTLRRLFMDWFCLRGNESLAAMALTLAVASVRSALDRNDWLTLKAIDAPWEVSEARLFYMRLARSLCVSAVDGHGVKDFIGAALSFAGDFGAAFACPQSSNMMNRRECSTPVRPRSLALTRGQAA